MTTASARRPGGRSERVRQAVLAAADDLAERGEEITVAALADRAGVSEVTIYRRWRAAENVLLDAAVQDVSRRLPVTPTGNLQHDLTSWARNAERSIAAPRGRRLLAAVAQVTSGTQEASERAGTRSYLEQRAAQIQELIDAADPAATVTVAEVLDFVLAPIYLRQLFGYQSGTTAEQLVSSLLSHHR